MRDLKYIIKRVIIGVGIVLVLSCLNGCKVKALDTTNMTLISNYRIKPNTEVYSLYYDRSSNRYYVDNPRGDSEYITDATDYPYIYCWNWKRVNGSDFASAINGVADSDQVKCVFSNKKLKYFYNSQYAFRFMVSDTTFNYKIITSNYNNGVVVADVYEHTAEYNSTYNVYQTNYGDVLYNYPRNGIILSNYDIYNYSDNELYYGFNLSFIPGVSEFVSWNSQKIVNNNILLGYNFKPEFSNFDTTNYVYQYKVGSNSTTWLGLFQNKQSIDINANTILYVRIKDLQDNIIDSATFTITGIGSFANSQNVEYDINFSGEYRTENYLNNNISKSQSIIQEYQIYVDYIPKTSILKYQYQFVIENGSLDNNSWENVPSSDNGSTTYVATSNGTLYARILDSEDNVLYTATFTVNSIGLLAFDNNGNTTNNFFEKLRNKINYGGPVSSLFVLPVSFFSNLYNSMSNSNTCSNIQLGSILSTNLSLPCVDIPRYFGTNVYNIIDFIFSFILLVGIFRFVIKKYNKFITMEDIGDDL